MKILRIFAGIIFLLSAVCTVNVYAEEDLAVLVSCGDVKIKGNAAPGNTVVCAVSSEYNNTVFFEDCICGENGEFIFPMFAMPDVENPETDCAAEYTVTVNAVGDTIYRSSFYYYGIAEREKFIGKINESTDSDKLEKLIESNEVLFAEFGINTKLLKSTDGIYDGIFNALPLPTEDRKFADSICNLILVEHINSADGTGFESIIAENAHFGINAVFQDMEITENESMMKFVCKYLQNKRKFQSLSEFNQEIQNGAVLYTLSNSGKLALGDVVLKYYDIIGISTDSIAAYKKSEPTIRSVNSYILENMGAAGFSDFENFRTLFNAGLKTMNRTANEGGSSGSSSSKGISIGTGKTVEIQTMGKAQDAQSVFSDIDSVPWAKESIQYLAEVKVIIGDGRGRFRPNDTVSREEFVKMLMCLFEIAPTAVNNQFADVSADAWYFGYVGAAAKYKIVTGIDNRLFGVGTPVTRQDAAVMLIRACEYAGIAFEKSNTLNFADSDEIAGYAKNSVSSLVFNGIITGTDHGTFEPRSDLTRAQAAKLMYGVNKYKKVGVKPE